MNVTASPIQKVSFAALEDSEATGAAEISTSIASDTSKQAEAVALS